MHVIGLDIGTTGVKACVFDADGAIKGYGFAEYSVICDTPGMGEQDAALVWNLTKKVIVDAVNNAGPQNIVALSLSAQGDAIIALDANHNPLHNAILGMDYRCETQVKSCARMFGDRNLYDRTGMRPHPMNALCKMLWLREHHPEVWDKAARICTYADYVTARLCGEAVIDSTMASRTMAFDLERREWADDILSRLRIDRARLSPVAAPGTVVGKIIPGVARELKLSEKVTIVAGGHDQSCAALGAGVVAERRAVISTGTAIVLSTAFAKRPLNDIMYSSFYPCYLHTAKDLHFTFALNHAGGILFRWYRDTLGAPEVQSALAAGADPYQAIIDAMPSGLSPVMILPHFNGSGTPSCDIHSKGAIVGLTLSTTRHEIALAVLEALTFEMRVNCQQLRAAGFRHDELVVVGGGARSERWLQLMADILGCPVRTLAVREAACLGAGLLAACASGMYGSLDEGVARTVKTKRVYEPRPQISARYDERFVTYEKLYPALKTFNHRMA